jgi:hypothetical protein
MFIDPDLSSLIPPEKAALLQGLTQRLSAVAGVRAIVLGGSYARRTHTPASDLDVGIYYSESAPFEIDAIRQVAEAIAVQPPTVTDFYGWGRWVNGGAWIRTAAGKVDFLYRNLEQVQRTIAGAQQGEWAHDYDQQPAYGFYSVIYLAETSICLPLYDPEGLVAGLKRQVAQYPPRLKARILSDSLWSVEFTLLHARGFAASGDVYGTTGCLGRAASNLTQALYALNETYFMSDKKAMQQAAKFSILPGGYIEKLNSILAHAGSTPTELEASVESLNSLWRQIVALCPDEYRSRFKIP